MDTDQDKFSEANVDIRDKLNTETGKLAWCELERFYAKGSIIKVDQSLDLIDVAAAIVEDKASLVVNWMQSGLLAKPLDEDVIAWVETQPLFWAVVVSPWVVVQEIPAAS